MQWNADGLRHKLSELHYLALKKSCNIITVCETLLEESITIAIPGFSCYRQDRHPARRGRGVAIFIKSDIAHTQVSMPRTSNLEAVGVKLCISGSEHVIVSSYQSPNLDIIGSDLDTVFALGNRVLILGDLNARHPLWCPSGANKRGRNLFDHILQNDYAIHAPKTPTLLHYRLDCQPTTPDLALALNVDVSSLMPLTALSSNHLPIIITIAGHIKHTPTAPFFNYSEADWKGFRSYIDKNIYLSSKTYKTFDEIEAAVTDFSDILIKSRDEHVPIVTPSGKPKELPRFIINLIKTKDRLRSRAQRSHLLSERILLRRNINYLQNRIKDAIKSFNDKKWLNTLSKVENHKSDLWRVC